MNESDFKTDMVKKIRSEGGYGRRIEDSFAVGTYDMVLIPNGGPVFFCEAKIIRSANWGATARQMVELERAAAAGGQYVRSCEIGFEPTTNKCVIRIVNSNVAMAFNYNLTSLSAVLRELSARYSEAMDAIKDIVAGNGGGEAK